MQDFAKKNLVQDAWQTPRNARTLAAYMALQNREVGERIAKLRSERGNPPQEIVATKLGVAHRSYQAWEAGDTKPSWRNLEKLAAFYSVSPEYILTGEELAAEPNPHQSGTRLDVIVGRLDQIEDRQEDILNRLTGVGKTLDKMPPRIDLAGEQRREIEARLDAMERNQEIAVRLLARLTGAQILEAVQAEVPGMTPRQVTVPSTRRRLSG